MQINKHGSFYLRNGWPTKIIDVIIQNRYVFSPANEREAVDALGVGRVMVKAMRYWAYATGLTVEDKDQQGVLHSLTELGECVAKYDPFCQDKGTLWLMHRKLASDFENATMWAWAFNLNSQRTFSKDEFVDAFFSFYQTNGGTNKKNAVEKEFDCLKNTYVSDKSFDLSRIIDEDTIPFFAPLGLIKYLGKGRFEMPRIRAKVLQVLGVKIYASEVEWQVTHEDVDLIFNLPRDDDEAFRKGYELLLEWLTIYDQVLDGSILIMEDGTQVKLSPSESTPYENGVVTLYSHLASTIDLRKVVAISVLGQEIAITNPFR